MKKLNLLSFVLLAAVAVSIAETSNTVPVGYQTITIKGTSNNGNTGSYFNFVPVQLSKQPAFTGSVASISGNQVNLNGASLGDVTTLPHYLIIQSGDGVGYLSDVSAATSTSVTTVDDLSAQITTGTTVSIIPHVLLTDVFGTGASLVLQGGNPTSADTVYLVGSDGAFKPYYYKNSGFGQGWKNASTGATEATIPVYPSESILVERKAETDTQALTQFGNVAQDSKSVYAPGFNSAASAYPSTMALSALQGVVQGGTASTADIVYIVNQDTGQLSPYYYKNSGFGRGWKDAASGATVDATAIDIRQGFILERKESSNAVLAQTKPY